MAQDHWQVDEQHYSRGRISVERIALTGGTGHEAHFRLCSSGSATLGVDYNFILSPYAGPLSQTGNCLIAKFPARWNRVYVYIAPVADSIDEPNETIIITLSQDSNNPFPSGYMLPSHYTIARLALIDND
ncbi:MAG: hypothetical protein OXE95_13420 [Chloroflexi bacterium]|nr:hypothetical protein [Chloroflexota bacterium]